MNCSNGCLYENRLGCLAFLLLRVIECVRGHGQGIIIYPHGVGLRHITIASYSPRRALLTVLSWLS